MSELTVVRKLAVGLQTARLVQVVLQDDVGFVVLKKQRAIFAFWIREQRDCVYTCTSDQPDNLLVLPG